MTFGLAAGMSPGPLLTLVITETLQRSKVGGIKVAVAPLITDAPIILVTLFVLSRLPNFKPILGIIALIGGLFVAYLGYGSVTTKGVEIDFQETKSKSVIKGVLVNALSPHPYLFWMTVGAPMIHKAYQVSLVSTIAFVVSFFAFLVGSKVGIALLVDKSRTFLKSGTYILIMRSLGIVLFIFAMIFIKEGLQYLTAV